MILASAFGVLLSQAPTTFVEVELEKIKAYVGLRAFREEMHISLSPGDPRGDFVRLIEIDGSMSRAVILMPDLTRLQAVCDGKTRWAVHQASKTYSEGPASDGKTFKPSDHLAKAKEVDSFELDFDSVDRPVRFDANPGFVLKSIAEESLDGEKLRKVVAVSVRTDKAKQVTLTQWYLPDKWILKSFTLTSEGKTLAEGRCKVLDFNATFERGYFVFNADSIKGFKRVNTDPG